MSDADKATVLCVDDKAENLFVLERILEDSGYTLLQANSGYEALRIALKHEIDLILLDVRMPGMDGYQVCARLKEDERTRDIPVIFISALGDLRDKVNGFQVGGVDYVTKPLQAEEVRSRVKSHLAIQQLQHALREKNQELSAKNQELQHALEREQTLLERERTLTEDLRMSLSLSLPHELRTPLNAILGFSELLMRLPSAPTLEQVKQYGQKIYDGGRRLERIVENALFYAKLQVVMYTSEESRMIPHAESVDVAEVVATVAQQQAECADRQADLIVEPLHVTLRVSPTNLTKILMELLDNAFKFSKPGTLVRIATTVADGQCVVRISDQGRGMTREQIAEIGAYMQFDRRRHEQQGIGLGLIIVSLLTQLEGGALSIESDVDQGATISLTFAGEAHDPQPDRPALPFGRREGEPASRAIVPPPPERLRRLRESVIIGDIMNIQKQIEEINALAPQYAPFAEKLSPLARDMNISAIERFIESFLRDKGSAVSTCD